MVVTKGHTYLFSCGFIWKSKTFYYHQTTNRLSDSSEKPENFFEIYLTSSETFSDILVMLYCTGIKFF